MTFVRAVIIVWRMIGSFLFELVDQALDAGTFEVGLRAAEIAGNDRELPLFGVCDDLVFLAVGERADDRVAAVVAAQDRRHRLELADVEEVHQKGRDDVVARGARARSLCSLLRPRRYRGCRGEAANKANSKSLPSGMCALTIE